jgi:hypothetical protein
MKAPDDDLIAQSLKMNWEHARHVEAQRMGALAIHVVMALGLGYAAIFAEPSAVRWLASELGFCATLVFWGITHKQNRAFRNQLVHAARAAQRVTTGGTLRPGESLIDFLAFPGRPSRELFGQIRVGMMFHFIYATFALNWALLLGYMGLRLFIPEVAL